MEMTGDKGYGPGHQPILQDDQVETHREHKEENRKHHRHTVGEHHEPSNHRTIDQRDTHPEETVANEKR
jgi:hypothetical protein